jgi:glycosyltransferase involved in cell wall biosynthesis
MNILMILSNPLLVDPRVHKEAKTLVEQGHQVTVLVWDRKHQYQPEETVDGIRIVRIHNTGILKVVRNDLFRNPFWWRKAYTKGIALNASSPIDIVHCHDLDTLQAGVWLKKKLGVKLIYDAHELWGHLIQGNVPNIVVQKAFTMEKKLVQHVDHIITVSPPFKDYFASICTKPVTLVMNCKDLLYTTYEPPHNKKFTLLYIGGMKTRRFFPEIIDIISSLPNTKLILGGKKEDLYDRMKKYARHIPNIEFKGTIPTEEILPLTQQSDATFIIVDPTSKHYQKTLFNKQFEAMVCGRPIITTKGTYAGTMTEELHCGLTVDYDKASVKKTIKQLQDNPNLCKELGKHAFQAAQEKYNWKNEQQNLIAVYKDVTV